MARALLGGARAGAGAVGEAGAAAAAGTGFGLAAAEAAGVEAEAVEEGLILGSVSPRAAAWQAEQVCGPWLSPSHCSLFSGLPFRDTSWSLLSFLPALNHSVPVYAVALFLQIQARRLWLLRKALFEKMQMS